MPIGDVVQTKRADVYHVEIRHPGEDWVHIHPPAWETRPWPAVIRMYARRVVRDHPDAEVRIIQTIRSEVTTLSTGETQMVELGTQVHAWPEE